MQQNIDEKLVSGNNDKVNQSLNLQTKQKILDSGKKSLQDGTLSNDNKAY